MSKTKEELSMEAIAKALATRIALINDFVWDIENILSPYENQVTRPAIGKVNKLLIAIGTKTKEITAIAAILREQGE